MPNKQNPANQTAASGLAKSPKLLALAALILLALAVFIWYASDNAVGNNNGNNAGNANQVDSDWVNRGKDQRDTSKAPPAALPGAALAALNATNSGQMSPAQKLALAQQQLELAEHTYSSYLARTKYPQQSRPISEHPDQIYPNKAIEETHALRKTNGQIDSKIDVQTTQSRVFIGSKESVTFSVSAVDKNGVRQPVNVTRAIARAIAVKDPRKAPQATLQFADDGQMGDAIAGDNVATATITPAATAFGSYNGAVRVEVNFNVGDATAFVNFDFIYTPDVPATWAGNVREAQEGGALNFYLKANVQQPGRYLVSGRIDDATGKPIALLTFNDMLAAGSVDIKLPLFGKLVRDQNPVFPLTLRDVEGYLLKEDTDPDRALMQRLAGTVLVSKKYAVASFSDAEWDSEQRKRYLDEYAKDVQQAKTDLAALKKGQ